MIGKFIPYRLYKRIIRMYEKTLWDKDYVLSIMKDYLDIKDVKECYEEIIKNGFASTINGGWVEYYYRKYTPVVKLDRGQSRYYAEWPTLLGTHKLYFKRGQHKNTIRSIVSNLAMEQDYRSPHCYIDSSLEKEILESKQNGTWRGGTIIDLGSAEGTFACKMSGLVNRVVCFDPDPYWNECVKLTFKDEDTVVECINGYVSSKCEPEKNVYSLDGYFGDEIPKDIELIKMDIEGYEQSALLGMKNTLLCNPKAILLICSYHQSKAEFEIRSILEPMGYSIKNRRGGMLFLQDQEEGFGCPIFRHGVLEARKVK